MDSNKTCFHSLPTYLRFNQPIVIPSDSWSEDAKKLVHSFILRA